MADFKEVVQRQTSCDSKTTTSSYPTGRGIYLSDSSRLQLSPQLIKSNGNIKLQNNYLRENKFGDTQASPIRYLP
ncbi:MAG: hypothetical protein KME64_17465 [Scytonematopsis contorta HA4267-MV1]|jgi:hypothetical protein|nr:hypothetical protein [Scytonematopsis contorta HA4267-MV1]